MTYSVGLSASCLAPAQLAFAAEMRPLPTFGSKLTDAQLWRRAQEQIDLHGTSAVIMTHKMRVALAKVGAVDSINIWSAIELRIMWLQRAKPDDAACH